MNATIHCDGIHFGQLATGLEWYCEPPRGMANDNEPVSWGTFFRFGDCSRLALPPDMPPVPEGARVFVCGIVSRDPCGNFVVDHIQWNWPESSFEVRLSSWDGQELLLLVRPGGSRACRDFRMGMKCNVTLAYEVLS